MIIVEKGTCIHRTIFLGHMIITNIYIFFCTFCVIPTARNKGYIIIHEIFNSVFNILRVFSMMFITSVVMDIGNQSDFIQQIF